MAPNAENKFNTVVKLIFMTIFGAIFSTVLLGPIILAIAFVFYPISRCAFLAIKLQHGRGSSLAEGRDSHIAKASRKSNPMVNVLFRGKGRLNVESFRRRFLEILGESNKDGDSWKYRRLRQSYRRCWGYYAWVPQPDFDIQNHTTVVTRDEFWSSRDGGENDQWEGFAQEFLNRYGNRDISDELPQWEAIFYEQNEQRYFFLFRFHHAISDGVFMVKFLSDFFSLDARHQLHTFVPPSPFMKIIQRIWSFCLLPFGILKILLNNDRSIWHGPKLTGKMHYYITNAMPLSLVKNIRLRTGASFSGILLSSALLALSKHFQRRNCKTKGLTMLFPVPLQNLQKPIELKNRFGLITLKFPIGSSKYSPNFNDVNLIPLSESLRTTEEIFKQRVGDLSFSAMQGVLNCLFSLVPAPVMEYLIKPRGITAIFTSLPGPQEKFCIEGKELEEAVFWSITNSPLGVGISFLTYSNTLRGCLTIDESLLKSQDEGKLFVEDVENFLKRILDQETTPQEDRNCC